MAVKVERMERRIVLLQKKSTTCNKPNVKACSKLLKQNCADSDDCDILEKTSPFGEVTLQDKQYEPVEKKEIFQTLNVVSECGLLSGSVNRTSKAAIPVEMADQTESIMLEFPEADDPFVGPSLAIPSYTNMSVDSSNPSTPASAVSPSGPSSPLTSLEHHNGHDDEVPVAQAVREMNCIRTKFLTILHEGTFRGQSMDDMDLSKASQGPMIKGMG